MRAHNAPAGGFTYGLGMPVATRRVFEIKVGDEYIPDLKRRLKKAGVSHGMLAREMGWSASQLSRSFNKPMVPSGKTIARMETAFRAILERQKREGAAASRPERDG